MRIGTMIAVGFASELPATLHFNLLDSNIQFTGCPFKDIRQLGSGYNNES
jgi:hypothetical protein